MFVQDELSNSVRTKRIVLLIAIAALLVAVPAFALTRQPSPPGATPASLADAVQPIAPATVLIFVSGAVEHPGLYRVSASARVADALAEAGGVTPMADPGRMPNLSALVHDGRQINVPFFKGTSAAAKLDINAAALDELASVPGMPAGLPEAIVQFREQWGGFSTLSQLRSDLGVDSATVAALRLYLKVVAPPAP
jgi:competence protein ComEA